MTNFMDNSRQFEAFGRDESDRNFNHSNNRQDQEQRIRSQLQRCSNECMKQIELLFAKWKEESFVKYQNIITNIEQTLQVHLSQVIFQQINIQKNHFLQEFKKIKKSLINSHSLVHKENNKGTILHDQTVNVLKRSSKQNETLKTRSFSGEGFPRRRLSKGSFFAQAKKIGLNDTVTQKKPFFSHTYNGGDKKMNANQGSKIKKGRKKQQNYFDAVKNINKCTSSNNFMLAYAANKQQQSGLHNSSLKRGKANELFESRIEQKYIIQVTKPVENKQTSKAELQQNCISVIQQAQVYDTPTYQKLMNNFEDKISKKLDDILGKYTTIEQKLENVTQMKSPVSQIYDDKPQPANIKLQKVNSSIRTKFEEPLNKSIKCIDQNNKIVKNKTRIIQNFKDSLEQIPISNNTSILQKVDSNDNQQKRKQQQQNRRKQNLRKIAFQKDKHYFQKAIIQFFSTTKKVILPISEQFLFVLKAKYDLFCSRNDCQKLRQIITIPSKALNNIQKDYVQLLTKIEKVMDSKCDAAKKQKLILYFNKLILALWAFDEASNNIRQLDGDLTPKEIKQKIHLLKQN